MLGGLVLFVCFLGSSFAETATPTARLNGATITGINQDAVSKFLGIPYASPPIGDLRFRRPRPFEIHSDRNVQAYGSACPQRVELFGRFVNISALGKGSPGSPNFASPESEDCLTINVIRPLFVGPQDNYPVVVVGVPAVHLLTELKNHGCSGFTVVALNMAIRKQRVALRWVKRHIGSFGGNSSQVMIWGESAGSISVALQMIGPDSGANKEDLFHSAFMQSGTVLPVGHIRDGQKSYDFLLNETGCAKPKTDTLSCLRGLRYATLKAAVDKGPGFTDYQSLSQAWIPRTDGIFLKHDPQKLVELGSVAKVPFVAGCTDDEGTVFALPSQNLTTEADFRKYVSNIFIPKARTADVEKLWTLYPSTPSAGSPFDTGNATVISPQFKRMAAFQGDALFHAPTRFFLQSLSGRQKTWFFLSKRLKSIPVLGSFHSSDILLNLTDDFIIRFAVKHDPNNGTGVVWPQYTKAQPRRYTFPETGSPTIGLDTERAAQMAYLTNLSLFYPI
ncbi:hypothetical protein M413DRAFT_416182 [Hebeloma cylindrosporum]|uniref:Carboxylic ester hydrolase n=1 Tax=Hebeloma cylindrosporum TaxID=76867 RepID=A0A0C3CFC9_HEBCY|nr:hypothetical protein M413DRAFT_416182 [Hebeloma cylindrosporum h7]